MIIIAIFEVDYFNVELGIHEKIKVEIANTKNINELFKDIIDNFIKENISIESIKLIGLKTSINIDF